MIAIITNNLLGLKEHPTKRYLSAFLSFSFGFGSSGNRHPEKFKALFKVSWSWSEKDGVWSQAGLVADIILRHSYQGLQSQL